MATKGRVQSFNQWSGSAWTAAASLGVIAVATRSGAVDHYVSPFNNAAVAAGYVSFFATRFFSRLLAAAVARATGLRIRRLQIGRGRRIGEWAGRTTFVDVRIWPVDTSFTVWFPARVPLDRAVRRFEALNLLCFGVFGLLALALPEGPVRTAALIGWACAVGAHATYRNKDTGRTRLSRALIRRHPTADQEGATRRLLLRDALDAALSDRIADARAVFDQAVAERWDRGQIERLRLVLAAAEGRFTDAVALAEAVIAEPRAVELHRSTRHDLSEFLLRAAEEGTLPLAEALPRAEAAHEASGCRSCHGFPALHAALSGDFDTAVEFATLAVRSDEKALSRADENCTLAVALAGARRWNQAEAALQAAERLAPTYPRVATVRRRLTADPVAVA